MIASYARLKKIREAMQKQGIDIYVMVNSDPHESEYLTDYWKSVEWLSGFQGEVATIVITQELAFLWTDSRFFISGAEQLKGTPFVLKKLKIDEPPTEWILEQKNQESHPKVGGDLRVIFGEMRSLIDMDADLISGIWKKRPELPKNKIEVYPLQYDGEKAESKMQRIVEKIADASCKKALLLTALDDIAWTLNLRGSDVECTPVFLSYLLIAEDKRVLYIDPDKLTDEVINYLNIIHVETAPYEAAPLHGLEGYTLADANPVPLMKAIKNKTEIEGYRNAMLKDGIALTRFYHWLEEELNSEEEFMMNEDGTIGISGEVSELDCVKKLIEFRKEQPLYREESFPAIVAWRDHAALPHYMPTEASNSIIQGDGLLLIDTGGQYLDGTTDITRTIGVGRVSAAMKRDFTLVLKGHIRLAQAVFPTGSRGDQLDALARIDLWRDGKTYRHGTCHGVGHYLAVHEGPESVRMEHNPQQLLPGMVFSNEPAIYIQGKYGVRHENCVLVRHFDVDIDAPGSTPCEQEEQGDFLCLDTLTLCYIDTSCVDTRIMNEEEIEWLNNYNQWVYSTLAPHLDEMDRLWLGVKCQPIQ
ncbi:MAG: aminopeptidase P family protein [Bacteroidales bacterium]|nr:aminopeptidase P family protein [Bacteroidales bacterium]